jgi:hypothetical protein
MLTVEEAIAEFQIDVDPHLDRQVEIPVLDGLQFQGDVAVVPDPIEWAATEPAPVPQDGVAVIRGEAGGNTHMLLAQGPVYYVPRIWTNSPLVLGRLLVPEGSVAYLAHPEHSYAGIAPGTYELRRQREQADVVRMVAD